MKARTIAEVVAGEMTHGPYAMSDALGIASVIANRAKAYGVTPESVITSGQFNAYGKSLPKGVGAKEIAMAQKAIDTVAQNGPVTPATHYARPEAAKNIKGWSSFKQVDRVPGAHVYAVDPEMRPLPTAQGVMQAQPNAFQDLMSTATENAVKVARTVAAVPQAAAAMAQRGYDAITGQNQAPPPTGDVAGLYAGGLRFSHPEQTGINPGLRSALIGASAERQQPLGITSGYRSPAYNASIGGAEGSQHMHRNAADIDMSGMTVPERQQLMSDLRQRGVTRFGTYDKYPDMLHVDVGQPPAGQVAHFMHNESVANINRAPGWMRDTANFVRENKAWPTPETAPAPAAAPRAPATSQEAAYAGMAETMGKAGVPHIGLSPAMAAQMTAPPDTGTRVGTDTAPAPASPAGSVLGRMPGGMEANIQGAGPAQLSPQGQTQIAAIPASAPAVAPAAAVPAAVPAPAPAAAAIPEDPGIAARLSLEPGEVRPSLTETGPIVAGQPAPTLPAPTVVADQPVKAVQQTIQTSPTTIAPAPTIAPAAPPPAQPGGMLATIKDIAAATPYGRAVKGLASLAGPVPNPESYTYGTGAQAISSVLGGAGQDKPGATAYSKSTPGYSVKALGNGMVEKTNQYGAKSYEHVGTPGSGILSGQPQPGGWRGGFGLSGLGMGAPSTGGWKNTLGRMALSGIGGMVAGPIGAIAAPMMFGGMLNNALAGVNAGSGGGGWGNTANVGPNAMGFAGPWGGGGSTSSSGRASSSGGGGWAGGGMGGRANSPGSSGWGGGGKKK